jgi:hypothetical protein
MHENDLFFIGMTTNKYKMIRDFLSGTVKIINNWSLHIYQNSRKKKSPRFCDSSNNIFHKIFASKLLKRRRNRSALPKYISSTSISYKIAFYFTEYPDFISAEKAKLNLQRRHSQNPNFLNLKMINAFKTLQK